MPAKITGYTVTGSFVHLPVSVTMIVYKQLQYTKSGRAEGEIALQ